MAKKSSSAKKSGKHNSGKSTRQTRSSVSASREVVMGVARTLHATVNAKLASLRSTKKEDVSRRLEKLLSETNSKVGSKKGRQGEVALGSISRMNKVQIQERIDDLNALLKAINEESETKPKGYDTYVERYGDISVDEYKKMWGTFEAVKELTQQWGYEDKHSDFSGSITKMYNDANDKGKAKFADYVRQAQSNINSNKNMVKTGNALLREVRKLMEEDELL